MADVKEIIEYMKSLKKRFDKNLFQRHIEELTLKVDEGLEYIDYHTLFKIWLNLSIPITKWVSVGVSLVTKNIVQEHSVTYVFRWIMANYLQQKNSSRVAFVLDWLTAAMDNNAIDMKSLDCGYDIFYDIMLTDEVLTAHAFKLVYTLTKPADVTRRKVLELMDCAKKKEGKRSIHRQLQILLGLFKSYKPECVPEDVPAMSINTSFKKINQDLTDRFKKNRDRRDDLSKEKYLLWVNPINSIKGRNKKLEPLVPNMEFCNIGSAQYNDGEQPQKSHFDFTDAASLLQCGALRRLCRPARLRSLLCNPAGLTLLAASAPADHAFLAHDLQHMLTTCFLNGSAHSYAEKRDLLRRLVLLQRTLLQPLPVVTAFLAQYLPVWNEMDYTAEILELAEWIDPESPEHVACVVEKLSRVYLRAHPIEQCAILTSLTNMYTNLVFASTRKRLYFMNMARPSEATYSQILPTVASYISDLSKKALQINPEDMRVCHSVVCAWARCARAERAGGRGAGCLPPRAALSVPLLLPSAALLEHLAALLLLYKKIFTSPANKSRRDEGHVARVQVLKRCTSDLVACLYGEEAVTARREGLAFTDLPDHLLNALRKKAPDVDACYSIRNHLAFAPYTYANYEAADGVTNKMLFDLVIDQEFVKLSQFLKKTVPQILCQK